MLKMSLHPFLRTALRYILGPFFWVGLVTSAGCPQGYIAETSEVAATQSKPLPLADRVRLLEARVAQLEQDLENEKRRYWSEKICQKDRDKIVAFLAGVKQNTPEVCTPVNLENALQFMNSQPLVVLYLDPKEGLSSLHPARQAFIRDTLLNERLLHPSTRLFILVQPHEESSDASSQSLEIARSFVDKLRGDMLPVEQKNFPVLGPSLLPCNLRKENALQKLYSSSQFAKLSESLPGEPTSKQPRIRIWVFRTDCW